MPRLEIHSEPLEGGKLLVSPKGKLDVFAFGELKSFFDQLPEQQRKGGVIVDLGLIDYIASSGWSVLLARRRVMRLAGGELVICGLSHEIKRVYQSMKIMNLLPEADSLPAALEMLKKGEAG